MNNLIDLIDLDSLTFNYRLGEYPDLDSATVRGGKYKDGSILSKEDKIKFKDEYPESFYQLLWDFIGQYGR